jgi:glycosyltransferase involved in cell wall biosynthesis
LKRALLITDIFPPDIGGPATFIDRLGWSLSDRGVSVTVVCATPLDSGSTDAERPFRVHRVPGRGRTGFGLRLRCALARHMLGQRHILVNGLESYACTAARITGRKYVIKVVGDSLWETARNSGRTPLSIDDFQSHAPRDYPTPWLDRAHCLARARSVITPCQYLVDLVKAWGADDAGVHVVYNGVPQNHSDTPGDVARRTTEPLRLVFCGRLTNWKGVDTLLLALRDLEHVHLDVIGDGPEFPMLRAISNQLGLDERVVWHGRLDQDRLADTLSAGHVAVLISGYEGLSHALLESAHHGLVPIASHCGGNPEWIQDGHNGLLVPFSDVEALRDAIKTLHSNEDLRYRLAREAQRTAQQFDFERTVSQTIQILQAGDM